MTARPCGVYVRASDVRTAVSGAQDVTQELKDQILDLMEQSWREEVVDVMMVAERFWNWQFEMTNEYQDPIRSEEFKIIMERIKDNNIVPTVATFATGTEKAPITQIVDSLKEGEPPQDEKPTIFH